MHIVRCAVVVFVAILVAAIWFYRPGRPRSASVLEGTVVDERGAVAGARVKLQGECSWAVTDVHGRFRLPASGQQAARVTAWRDGYRIAAAPVNLQPLQLTLERLPAVDNEDYVWIEPAPDAKRANNCGNCHAEIYREWSKSAHASAATNRRFLNLLDGTDWHGKPAKDGWNLKTQQPDGAGVCATCHAPTFSDPALKYEFRGLRGPAAFGVHCDYCHKVVDAPTDQLPLRFGRDGLQLLRPAKGEQLFFGPLDDAVREGESFGHMALYKESRYCASCHEGVLFGVHAYSTYSEWLASPARRQGQECQSCHMAPTGHLVNIAPGKGGIERDPWTLSSHRLPGTQADMLRRCLKVTAAVKDNRRVNVEVRAVNVGHRVPTGFIDRHLVLVVEAFDRAGRVIDLRSGARLADVTGKELVGLPGKHYAKQIKHVQKDGLLPFWLLGGQENIIDTRLVPEQADRSEFVFAGDVARIRVRLLYRRFWPAIARSRDWPDNEILVVEQTQTVASK